MKHKRDDLRADEGAIDALLRERVGGDTPPDLVAAVSERYARGEGGTIAAQVAKRPSYLSARMLQAAVVLLGIGAVAGVLWQSGQDDSARKVVAASARGQDPQPTKQPAKPNPKPKGDKPTPGKPQPKAAEPGRPNREQNPGDANQVVEIKEQPRAKFVVGNLFVGAEAARYGDELFELKVLDHQGGPVQSFRATMLQVSPQGKRFARLNKLENIDRQPRDFAANGEFTEIAGLAEGRFAVKVDDGIHAPTISEPFTITTGDTPRIVVKLNFGCELVGSVLDEHGKPIHGAVVKTLAPLNPQLGPDNPFAKLMVTSQAPVHSIRSAKAADGTFRLQKLIPGSYRVRVSHPDYCPTTLAELEIAPLPPGRKPLVVVMQKGAIVHGSVRRKIQPLSGYKVSILPVEKGAGPILSAETNAQGQYTFPERLPPGEYSISCRAGNQKGNPLEKLLEMRRTRETFVIQQGKDRILNDILFE